MKMAQEVQDYGYVWTGYNLPANMEVFVGDFTGSKQNEVVAVHPTGNIFIFRYDGRIFRRVSALNLGRRITKAVVGDVDGDGRKEIIVASGNSFVVFKWRGGRFERIHTSVAMEAEITDIAAGNLTGGLVDEIVVVVRRMKILIYKIHTGSLVLITERASKVSLQIEIGNVIRHHQNQLVILEHVPGPGGDNLIVLILKGDQLEVVIEDRIGMKGDILLAVKDIDNDFMDEIIISVSNRRRLLVLGGSGTSFFRKWLSPSFSGVIEAVEVADWDRDGRSEIFIAVGSQVHIYTLRGRDYVLVKRIDMELHIASFAKGDLDRDGFIEVIVISKTGVITIVKDFFEAKSQFLVQQTVSIPKNLPPAIRVSGAKVDRVVIHRREPIRDRIIISGSFCVSIMYVAEPDRRVLAISAEIPFTHVVPVPGLQPGSRVRVDVEVEYVDSRFNSNNPRSIEVVIVAQIIVFDIVVRERRPVRAFASEHGVSCEELARINKLSIEGHIESGEKIKLPIEQLTTDN